MKFKINRAIGTSLYDQIYSELQSRIQTGILKPGTKLPSIRKLSHELNVSPMTIVKVYEALEEDNYIEKIHGSGSFVKMNASNTSRIQQEFGLNPKDKTTNDNRAHQWQDEVPDYVSRASFRYNVSLAPEYEGANLSIATLGSGWLPTSEILQKFNNTIGEDIEALGEYPPIEGDLQLRQEVCEYVASRNVKTRVDEVLITSGSQMAISLIAMTFLGPGDIVVMEAPTYPGAIDVIKSRGATIIEVPVDRYGLNTDVLLSVCENNDVKMVYTMPTFQNPTGVSMRIDRKQMLLELADEHNFFILEDDAWSDLVYEGTPEPLKALDINDRVIYICGFSKIYGPAYRISAVLTSGVLYKKLVSAKSILDLGTPSITQKFLTPYINSIEQKHYLIELRHELKILRDRLYKKLEELLPKDVSINCPSGGMIFWMTFPHDFDCHMLYYRSVTDLKISFLPGTFCYSSRKGSNQMRLCFTYLEETVLMESIEKLCALIRVLYIERLGKTSSLIL